MEPQKIKNLLDYKEDTYPKYQTKKWYVINDRNNGNYNEGDSNDNTIKIDVEIVKPFLSDYADAYILVTGDIADNYEDSTASLYQFKRQEQSYSNIHPTEIVNLNVNNSSSFKYKSE